MTVLKGLFCRTPPTPLPTQTTGQSFQSLPSSVWVLRVAYLIVCENTSVSLIFPLPF